MPDDPQPQNPIAAMVSSVLPKSNDHCPAPDKVLRLGAYIVTLCFAYLFIEIWKPDAKHGAAVLAVAMSVIGFYFGAMYEKGKKEEPPKG